MHYRKLGLTSVEISAIGLGCMGMSEFYGPTDETNSLSTLHRAFELGVNFIDTADMYGHGANEKLLAKALMGHRDKIVLATKFGFKRDANNPASRVVCGDPAYVRSACEASLTRLGVECIDLYYLHRRDPSVPIEETVGAMADLVKAGYVKYLGLSEVNPETLKKAHKIHPITALQTEYSLCHRAPEMALLPLCEQLGITFVAYSPLCRGLLTGQIQTTDDLDASDSRKILPRFQSENLSKNIKLVNVIQQLAGSMHCTPAQLMLAWELAQSPKIVPIPGTRHIKYLEENVAANDIQLTTTDLQTLNRLSQEYQVAGDRYYDGGMKFVDL